MSERPTPIENQNARFAIEGCMEYGRHGVNPPPDNHWLAPFWSIGQKLSRIATLEAENAALRAEVEGMRVAAKRYETVRRMNVITFREVYKRNIKEGMPFDDLIDAARKEADRG